MVVCATGHLAAVAGTTWDGGGINTNFTTSANWDADIAPTFTGGTSTLTFGSGGSTATVDTAADLARIILNRDAAFTLADGSGSLTLQGEDVGGVLTGITASPVTSGTTVAYTISESVALGATQSWNVANNGVGGTSLSVSGVISGSGVGLTKIGSGTLALSGANTFSRTLAVAEGVLSINSCNNVSTNGPLGNSAANVVLGSATTAGTLRYTGAAVDPPASPRGIELAAGGGVIQLTGVGRDPGRVHISGSSISGSGPLTINNPNGARFLIVGSSTFSGPLTVQAGELQLNLDPTTTLGGGSNGLGSAVTVNSGALLTLWRNNGSSTIRLGSLAGGGTVRVEGGGTQTLSIGGDDTSTTFSGVMQNTIALTKVGSGTLTLSGSNSYSGNTTISAGRLALTGNGVLGSGSYAGTIANAGELVVGTDAAQILAGVISGTGSVTKAGAGTLTLSGANTFSGPLTVADGTLSISSWNSANTNGPLGNSAANIVLGSATSAGTLRYTGGNINPPTAPRGIELAAGGGVIQLGGTGRDGGLVHISGSSISGSGPLTINNPSGARFLIVGSSTFSGPVTVQAGELQGNVVGAGSTFTPFGAGTNGLGSAVTVNAGGILTTFSSGGAVTVRLGSLAGSGTVRTESSGITQLQIGGDDTSTTFSGQLQGVFAPVKVGAGTLTLSGSSSYTGSTTVSAGRLVVDGSILASSSVSVASGAELGGSGRVAAITGAGLVAPGNSPGILTAPSASLSSGLDFAFEFTQPGAPTWSSAVNSGNDVLRLTEATTPLVGTATSGNVFNIYFTTTNETYIGGIFTDRNADFGSLLDAATFNYYVRDDGGTFSYGGFSYASLVADNVTRSTVQIASADFAGGTVTNGYAMQFVVVPEPGSLALAALGIGLAAGAARRRRCRA